MKNSDFEELIDKAMAGRLSPEEQRRWEVLLAARPELEEDAAVGVALRAMPPPPRVSSNFTALVLQEINRETHATQFFWVQWFRWPRLARFAGTAVVAFGLSFAVLHHERQQDEMANTVRTFASAVSAVSAGQKDVQPEAIVTVLKDFDAIRQLPDSVDYGLMAALRSNE